MNCYLIDFETQLQMRLLASNRAQLPVEDHVQNDEDYIFVPLLSAVYIY